MHAAAAGAVAPGRHVEIPAIERTGVVAYRAQAIGSAGISRGPGLRLVKREQSVIAQDVRMKFGALIAAGPADEGHEIDETAVEEAAVEAAGVEAVGWVRVKRRPARC